ncbi:hypothetical protein ACFO4O_07835 [Glaciecola siphonariae]|uniref:Uncharacterized protein n=1 Tax=Glaciecola siphonariae TaxID=521012 RepID=A0ABV9LWP5_9ALTE
MLNKKILATAVALACSTSAFAAVDLDDNANDQTVTIATESFTATDISMGMVEVTNAGALNIEVETGFTTGAGTSNFVRFDLVNGSFTSDAPTLTNAGLVGGAGIISQGGGDGDSFVIFEITADTADVARDATLVLAADTYNVTASGASTVGYGFFDIAADAINQRDALASASSQFTNTVSAVTGDYTDAGVGVATVASGFTAFAPATSDESATVANLGMIVPAQVVTAGSIKLDGTDFTVADVVPAGNQDITFAGDFSFGTFTLHAGDCTAAPNALTVNTDEDEAVINADPATAASWSFCVTVDGTETISKGSYTVTLDTPEVTNTIGQITFDTTTVEVPYLTTFSNYNQRLYIINRGSRDAIYTISFTSEDGVTATAGAGASGTVPANEVVALRATDIVTLTGRTRTAATVEIEAAGPDISVATQQVNLSDGTTDTVVLK